MRGTITFPQLKRLSGLQDLCVHHHRGDGWPVPSTLLPVSLHPSSPRLAPSRLPASRKQVHWLGRPLPPADLSSCLGPTPSFPPGPFFWKTYVFPREAPTCAPPARRPPPALCRQQGRAGGAQPLSAQGTGHRHDSGPWGEQGMKVRTEMRHPRCQSLAAGILARQRDRAPSLLVPSLPRLPPPRPPPARRCCCCCCCRRGVGAPPCVRRCGSPASALPSPFLSPRRFYVCL